MCSPQCDGYIHMFLQLLFITTCEVDTIILTWLEETRMEAAKKCTPDQEAVSRGKQDSYLVFLILKTAYFTTGIVIFNILQKNLWDYIL